MKSAMICGALAALLLLCSCGGGGSSATDVLDDDFRARGLLGADPLNISEAQLEAAFDRRLRQATALFMDIHDPGTFSGLIRSNCQGEVCDIGGVRYSLTEDFFDFAGQDEDEDGEWIEEDGFYLSPMSYRGTSILRVRGIGRWAGTISGGPVPIDLKSLYNVNQLGAWLDYSTFAAFGNIITTYYDGDRAPEKDNSFSHLSHGKNSGRPPRSISGAATWEGSMVAIDTESRHQIIGASTVQLDLAFNDVDVRMTDVWDMDAGTRLSPFDLEDLTIQANGTFGNGRTVMGSFYGPNHEEAGGIFTTSKLVGAFGAKQQ